MSDKHLLHITIEDDCCVSVHVECLDEGPDRPCGSFKDKDWPDATTCRCSELSGEAQCEACAEGYHDECAVGAYVNDIGPSCRAEPVDECWYEQAVRETGAEILDFGRGEFTLSVPVKLIGGGWEEPTEVMLVEQA